MEYENNLSVPQASSASAILKKMHSRSYTLKSRNKKQSKEFLQERFEQLKLDGKFNSPEAKMITRILESME